MNKITKYTTSWDDMPVIFDLPYASVVTGLSYDYIRKASQKGSFPARKIGQGKNAVWRVDRDEFIKWWADCHS